MGRIYHVWFSTKGRKDAFEGELGAEMKEMLAEIARNNDIRLIELELVADHAHLLIDIGAIQNCPVKGYGSRWVPQNQVEQIRRYIRTQRERPYRHAG
jgi:REP element-mobilizing transposase RayT